MSRRAVPAVNAVSLADLASNPLRPQQTLVYTNVAQVGAEQQQQEDETIGAEFTLFGDGHHPFKWRTAFDILIIVLLLATLAVSIVAMIFAIKAWKKDPCDNCSDDLILSESTGDSTTADGNNSSTTTGGDSTTSTTTDTTGGGQTSFDISETTTTGAPSARRRGIRKGHRFDAAAEAA